MTKLVELKATLDVADAAYDAATKVCDAALEAYDAAYDAYAAELRKQETNNDQVCNT